MTTETLATIELDINDGAGGGMSKERGELYFYRGSIWCRVHGSGENYDTQTPCDLHGAIRAITVGWTWPGWDLQLVTA